MSKLVTQKGDDHPDAATKNLDDAETLLRNLRFDGAGYHAGYVIESSLKAFVQLVLGTELKGHRIDDLSADALGLVALLATGQHAAYLPNITSGHPIYAYKQPGGWSETMRYRGAGLIQEQDARSWIEEARRVHDSTVAAMRLNGVV